jgi:sugar (pentulose or hexulose) kinase
MDIQETRAALENGETYLGIELGSTRIKAVLVDDAHRPIASGGHTWENRLEGGIWTYTLDDVWTGLCDCYSSLAADVSKKYGITLEAVGAIGVSAMMHGYVAVDDDGGLLVPFRTWRNTITGDAAKQLTALFGFNIPQRWSVAHLYQAILNGEPHVANIRYLTTLAGYIHWQLTGQKVLGIGDASGMFPIDDNSRQYDKRMLEKFDALVADRRLPRTLGDILPKILQAGETAGALTAAGAARLDPSGALKAGIPMCPPEGDAGTGMVATNGVRPRTGNVSAGTSVFAMVVLEKSLSRVYPEIDMVTTPAGDAVAMVHCNNCTGDLDAWVKLLGEAAGLLGASFDTSALYGKLLGEALSGDADCGGLLSYNYISGEHVTGFAEGRPLFMRQPNAVLSLANFMRTQLYSACASLKIGMRILLEKENASLDSITGHGGFFKVPGVGQRIMAAVMGAPVTVMATAGEGGPWGMAVLAAYSQLAQGESLADYLDRRVFVEAMSSTVEPDAADRAGFDVFMGRYQAAMDTERAAVETFKA